jgi:hypothetical protein
MDLKMVTTVSVHDEYVGFLRAGPKIFGGLEEYIG